MADEHEWVGQVGVLRDGRDQGGEVVERSGHTTARHAGSAVLTHRHMEAGVGERLSLGAGVGAVVGGAPEPAVHDEHGGAHGLCRGVGEAQVVHLGRVDPVGARGGRGRRLAVKHRVGAGVNPVSVRGREVVAGSACLMGARHASIVAASAE